MLDDRLSRPREIHCTIDERLGDEPPDLGALRALAEREEWPTRSVGSPALSAGRCLTTIRSRRWPEMPPEH